MADPLLRVVREGVRIYDLSRPYVQGMPQSPNHPSFARSLPRRHGDHVRADGGSAANDLLILGTHVGTHIDALAHISHDGVLHGGADAASEQQVGFPDHGIHVFPPMLGRALLLDVPRALGVSSCEPGQEIRPEDLDAALDPAGSHPEAGDVLLVRSGWGARWEDGPAYVGSESGVPGVGAAGARWLAQHRPRAVGADTIAFERIAPGAGHTLLPAHRILLVEHGINIIETMNLEEIADVGLTEFTLALIPLPLVGATGSPVRPLAIVPEDARDVPTASTEAQ